MLCTSLNTPNLWKFSSLAAELARIHESSRANSLPYMRIIWTNWLKKIVNGIHATLFRAMPCHAYRNMVWYRTFCIAMSVNSFLIHIFQNFFAIFAGKSSIFVVSSGHLYNTYSNAHTHTRKRARTHTHFHSRKELSKWPNRWRFDPNVDIRMGIGHFYVRMHIWNVISYVIQYMCRL